MNQYNGTIGSLLNSNLRQSVEAGLRKSGSIANAPISCNGLPQNQTKIIIPESLTEKLAYIRSTISRQKGTGMIEELPFAMLGHKDNQGNVVIDKIVYDQNEFEQRLARGQRGDVGTAVAEFGQGLQNEMSNHLQDKNIDSPVVIHGHTHPNNPNVDKSLTVNYSLDDLNGYKDYQTRAQSVNKNCETYGMVINEIGDFNVVNYNASNNTFEREESVMLGNEALPSFTPGNYLVENSNENTAQNNQTSQNVVAEPKIEKVSLSEIKETGYYDSQPKTTTNENEEKPKRSIFSVIKDFFNSIFSAKYTDDLERPDILKGITEGKSVAKTDFGEKLRRLKQADAQKALNAKKMQGPEDGVSME